ncbi:pyrrolo-quinoline quinone [Salipiger sp. IMCC34102]|uniref:pyrroloquinoline quinone-dependent dehydrogenase n=1 Tax=Salipiger sp. IMCC34102 TaxID=2510647 RepID=UPI00101C9F13|nr:PQQ-binding-like beta-propeller repeat protein [Salipiger sp. IMCC34102]RYH04448.1 pyrrolo-quinoline quinone [Salipiger sp. IMCC34102]
MKYPHLQISALALALGCGHGAIAQDASPLEALSPVTQDTLQNPADGDWPNWRRTLDGWGYSPLDQINRESVADLDFQWGWAMAPGHQEGTPIVHDGVMFMINAGGTVTALDAANGEMLWEYIHEPPEDFRDGRITRGVALWGDHVYVATPDAQMIALDMKTGQVAWQSTIADINEDKIVTASPMAVNGKIITGFQGCSRFYEDKCAVVAFDAETGEELWRTVTVERETEDGGDTWGGQPWLVRGGGDVWTTATYDEAADLLYIGVSQAKPWSRLSRGQSDDSLHTSSTLALDPDTGEIVWYRQYVPGETNDMDEAFEHILVDLDGEPGYVNIGKMAILWRGNRETGDPMPAFDMGLQDQIDLNEDGTFAAYREGMIGELGVPHYTCPSSTGFRAARVTAFSPDTRALYVPMALNCDDGTIWTEVEMVEGGGGNGRAATNRVFHPDAPDSTGRFAAMNIDTGEIMWEMDLETPAMSGMVTTAGGLVFAGDWNRYFYAMDDTTGEVLWQTRLPQSASGMPISYEVDGTQYIGVPVGTGGFSWQSFHEDLVPGVSRPEGGNAMMVFALDD